MCEEESDDSEAVNKLLLINDSIHRTIERYRLMVKGDVDAATKIPKGTLGTTTRVTKNAANELSLIDLDGDDAEQGPGSPGTQPAAPAAPEGSHSSGDDLAGLSFFGESTLQPSISLGPSAPGVSTILKMTALANSLSPPNAQSLLCRYPQSFQLTTSEPFHVYGGPSHARARTVHRDATRFHSCVPQTGRSVCFTIRASPNEYHFAATQLAPSKHPPRYVPTLDIPPSIDDQSAADNDK